MEQTACFGKCPIYTLTIDGNGAAMLDARRFMDSLGVFEATLDTDIVCDVLSTAKKGEWETYDKEYLTGYSDMPSTILSYSLNQKDTFTVRFEGEEAPVELMQITERLKGIKENTKWIKTSDPILD